MEEKYSISILLTTSKDAISKMIYYLTGRGYTHAAIGLDDTEDTYYSFNIKGFRMEHPKRHADIITDSICYKLDVTKEEHERVTDLINEFQEKRFLWKYDMIGLVLCILRIPHKRKTHYICSQFVAELLEKSKIMNLRINPSLYFPSQLGKEVGSLMNVSRILVNPV